MSTQRFQPDACKKCGGRMRLGSALVSTSVQAVPDFSGDPHASTFYEGGPGRLVTVSKCERCGWSVRKVATDE